MGAERKEEGTREGASGHVVEHEQHGVGTTLSTERMYRQGFDMRQKVLGSEHPDTLTSMSNLASVLNN